MHVYVQFLFCQSFLHVHVHVDPYEDQFEKKAEKRKERVAKNEFQRLKNLARSQKGAKVKGTVTRCRIHEQCTLLLRSV